MGPNLALNKDRHFRSILLNNAIKMECKWKLPQHHHRWVLKVFLHICIRAYAHTHTLIFAKRINTFIHTISAYQQWLIKYKIKFQIEIVFLRFSSLWFSFWTSQMKHTHKKNIMHIVHKSKCTFLLINKFKFG